MQTLITSPRTARIILKPAVFGLSLWPAAAFARDVWFGELGPDPYRRAIVDSGEWALWFLVFTLALTPARRLTGWHWLNLFRRMLGLFAFFYATLHLLTWVVLDKFFDVAWMAQDVLERKFITVGMATWVILFLLAITSNTYSIRKLGRRWASLHRLVYLAGIGAVVHFWWLVKADITLPRRWAVTLAVLFAVRVWWAWRTRRGAAVRRAYS